MKNPRVLIYSILVATTASPQFVNSVFTGNSVIGDADSRGRAAFFHVSAELINCTIAANEAMVAGGGILRIDHGDLNLRPGRGHTEEGRLHGIWPKRVTDFN